MPSPTKKRELLPEQAAAAYEIDKHISVTAGPGSGKTFVLVERYLHILRRHPKISIDQIVAITFTNRAANEMRERLRAGLNQILQDASGDERRRWLAYKRTLDGAVITTIHGFCARLLREFPVEAGIDPQFLLLDEHRAAMLLESVVEEVLTEFISSGHVAISRLTLGVGRGKLAAALGQMYREVRGQGLAPAELAKKTARSHATEQDHAQALNELSRAMDEFLAQRRTTPAQRLNQSEVATAWRAFSPLIHEIPEIEGLADYCRTVESFRSLRPQARGDLKPYVNALDHLIWASNLEGRVPQISLDLFARDYALELVNVLSRIDERLNAEKQKLSALDFDDLEVRTLELLKRPEVLGRTAERYKFFLVDEFQDTNGLQRALLDQLVLKLGGREKANLFIVGDGKQSIYGFRGADVDVFQEMTATLIGAGGEEKPLRVNFRSQPSLINFFNHLFGALFKPDEEVPSQELKELGYVAHQASFVPEDPEIGNRKPMAGPLVEVMITTEASGDVDDPKAEQDSRELDAEQLALRINSLVNPTPDFTGSTSVSSASSDSFTQVVRHSNVLEFKDGGRDDRALSNGGQVESELSEGGAGAPSVRYSDIALLFRAMTNIQVYESAFRRANIPYQTVLGRGFYERPEITDLIQLLRFLDNKTDEVALAAVLRSPLCGLSDNALLALRCGPDLDFGSDLDASGGVETSDPLRHFTQIRRLLRALREHRNIAYISDDEHAILDRANVLISELIARRHHYPLSDLLRFAVDESEYLTVIAATFDGAQRMANVERLFTLAERFERAGAHLIRDFVRYVEEFEAIGSRESEGQIDEAANAVKLMTIHQAKGLEFPVVIIPELQRRARVSDNWFLLDRYRGLTLKVPDGRGGSVAGCTFSSFEQRHAWREDFESMRLLYVAATRAEDRLIFSGTTKDLESLNGRRDTWLKWIWQSLGSPPQSGSGIVSLAQDVEIHFRLNLADETQQSPRVTIDGAHDFAETPELADSTRSLLEVFPLLQPVEVGQSTAVDRFSVTQLINYQRCPRQYYFDRILHLPSADQLSVWNDAEALEPPANLTATLKGAVVHRFCETYATGEPLEDALRRSFNDVIRTRQAELADRLVEINFDVGVAELLPLAQNYLSSSVFERVERARALAGAPAVAGGSPIGPSGFAPVATGLWSELSFKLRRPLGILSGAIDKLLINPAANGKGFDVEIIDFKTNRMRRGGGSTSSLGLLATSPAFVAPDQTRVEPKDVQESSNPGSGRGRPRSQKRVAQFAFDFAAATRVTDDPAPAESSLDDLNEQVRIAASDYQLQMQAYALAVSQLMPSLGNDGSSIISTLHFIDPNVESHLDPELLRPDTCARAIDEAMMQIISSREPSEFPVRPELHCRICNFLGICEPGRNWLREL